MEAATAEDLRCAFCGAARAQVRQLIAAPKELGGAHICDGCIRLSAELVAGNDARSAKPPPGAFCAVHPGEPALYLCSRCGLFACGGCERRLAAGGPVVCRVCLERANTTPTPAPRFAVSADNLIALLIAAGFFVFLGYLAGKVL